MASIQKVDLVNIDLNTGNIHRSFFSHAIGLKDNKGDAFGVRVFRDGEEVDLTGASVQGVFMPPQGSPIAITSGNSVSGNEAYVVLPQACYDYEGQFTLAIKLVGGGITGTMRIVDGIVSNTHASGTVAPTSAVPTYQEVLATYDAMVAATAAANGAIAPTYSSSSTYAVGDYCIHDGGLYRCTTAITTGETWTAGHWTAAKLGTDLSAQKSAINDLYNKKAVTVSASGNLRVPYHIKAGDTIFVDNQSSGGVNLWTRATESGSDLEELGFAAKNKVTEFTATYDAEYIRIYSVGAGTVAFENPDLIIPVMEDGLSGLKEEQGFSFSHKNPISDVGVTSGYYVSASSGKIFANENFSCTDYIPISGAKKIGISYGLAQFAFYDKKKTFISGVSVANAEHKYTEYSVPDGAEFVRLSIYTSLGTGSYFGLNNGKECPIGDIIVDDTVTNASRDFATLRDAVEYAAAFDNARIIVKHGTYNLLNEFASEISGSQATKYGLKIGRGIHIIFASGTKVTANYAGNDSNVTTYFNPFYPSADLPGGFTLENLTIEASATRYCVHDELAGNDTLAIHRFINCKMSFDNTNAPINYYPQCIGGGTAKNTYVEIRGCHFKSKAAESSAIPLVSYHNANTSGAMSDINVSDSYFADKGTFRVSHYGPASDKSIAIVNNCSLGSAPTIGYEVPGATTPQNFELITFNNEIRQ